MCAVPKMCWNCLSMGEREINTDGEGGWGESEKVRVGGRGVC